MNEALTRMLGRYENRDTGDYVRALREILQELALLGLWRGKFFERAAFYGGTCLRILYGLDRFSEDLDFSLIRPQPDFDLSRYLGVLEREIASFGFEVRLEKKEKKTVSPVQSAFLKADTQKQLLVIKPEDQPLRGVHRGQVLRIRIEVDTDPPPGFETETKFLLQPIPFSVRTFTLPSLFAGKMHAVLCRAWKNRVKGRDWYDLVWFAGNHPHLRLKHLAERMIQSGHWEVGEALNREKFLSLAFQAIEKLDADQARREVEPFVKDPGALTVWSRELFREVVKKVVLI